MSEVALHAPFAGWLSALDEVADPVFADRMMGEGFAIDPVENVLRAPADAEVVGVPDSGHAVTLRLANGAELLIHLGLETVALGGAGFTPQVKAGDRVARGDALIAFDLDAIGRAARDLVTPIVAPGEGARIVVERPGRMVAAGDLVARLGSAVTAEQDRGAGEARRTIAVAAPHGLHARPAARIAALLRPYAAEVTLALGARQADARSTVALLTLGARHGDEIAATAYGRDAAAALDALAAFAQERFGDDLNGDAPPPRAAAPGRGICASPGLAIGRIRQFRTGAIQVREDGLGVAQETAALDEALRTVSASLASSGIAEAHRAILADPALRGAADAEIANGRSAGAAWRDAIAGASAALEDTRDARLAERAADLSDLERQVLLALGGAGEAPDLAIPPDTILVAHDLLPSQFLAFDRERLAGICTAAGGPTAHVAILAAAAGVPMLVAAGPAVLDAADGTTAILDADAGLLAVAPDAAVLARASVRIASARTARAAEARVAQQSAHTADGQRIEVFANLGSIEDAAAAVRAGAEGCGLLRTEFLFLDRAAGPGEDEQAALYRAIATTLGDRPLIVRTLDIGGDKPVPYLPRTPEENPALGVRGVRFSLARPDLLAIQMRAILRGIEGRQCRIMLPMIAEVAEVVAARALLDAARVAVGRAEPVELGVMIETPAAALIAGRLAEHADFLSVGTNDLTQYTLAADRGNAGVSAMLDPCHPAVLRLIALAAEGAAQHGRWLGVCGGLASDPRAATLLIGLGVTELSAVPSAVPAVKAAVRATTLADARTLASRALAASSARDVRAMLGAST